MGGEIRSLTQSSILEKGRCGHQIAAGQAACAEGLVPMVSRGRGVGGVGGLGLPADRVFWAHLIAASRAQSSGTMQGRVGQEEPSALDSC